MIVGFDYWNVISHHPEEFFDIMSALEEGGNFDIHVISAIGKGRVNTIANEIKQLPKWGWLPNIWYEHNVHEVVFKKSSESPQLKLDKCKELGIEIFFDDRQDVCDLLNANGILAFKVPRKDQTTDLQGERK